jgi:hypothetical protein
MSKFKKIAEEREKRAEQLYSMDADYAPYSRTCDECRVQKEILDTAQKKKLGLSLTEIAWKCPMCKEVTEATGGVDQQTHGFSIMNNDTPARQSIIENGFDNIDSIEADTTRKIRP